jgi:hypothetical protein
MRASGVSSATWWQAAQSIFTKSPTKRSSIRAAYKGSIPRLCPNHVGAAISRHKRAGRIEGRYGKLYATVEGDGATPAI